MGCNHTVHGQDRLFLCNETRLPTTLNGYPGLACWRLHFRVQLALLPFTELCTEPGTQSRIEQSIEPFVEPSMEP